MAKTNKFSKEVFVVRVDDVEDPYLEIHEKLDNISEECVVATYQLASVEKLSIKRELLPVRAMQPKRG